MSMTYALYEHRKTDGRSLLLFSEQPRAYTITNDLPPLDEPPQPHRRWHPLRQEWVGYNPGRNNRTVSAPDGYNPIAPVPLGGHPGEIPVADFEVAVFENRWPSLKTGSPTPLVEGVETAPADGACEVIVYTPDAEGSLGDLSEGRVELLLNAWAHRYRALMARAEVQHVLPFENRGAFAGTTLHHPHGQLYALPHLTPMIARQMAAEQSDGPIKALIAHPVNLVENIDGATAQVPPYARYPFETWLLPPRAVASPDELTANELRSFAKLLKRAVQRFDRLFEGGQVDRGKVPYTMWIALPARGYEGSWPFHIQIAPLQRGPGKFKYLASVEQITGLFLADILPEQMAEQLRGVSL